MHGIGTPFLGNQDPLCALGIVRILMLVVSADIVAVLSVLSVHIAWNFT